MPTEGEIRIELSRDGQFAQKFTPWGWMPIPVEEAVEKLRQMTHKER